MTRSPLSRLTFAAALTFGLACGGGDAGAGGSVTSIGSDPASPATPAPVAAPKVFVLADSSWDVTWPGREEEGTDHVTFRADGSVLDLSDAGEPRGKWKATDRTLHYDWYDNVTYDGEVAADGLKITGTWVMKGETGTWLAVPMAKVAPSTATPKAGGSGLPSCYDVTVACQNASDSRNNDCWSACDGDEGCRDACAETNRQERWDCSSPTNCQ